MISSLCWYLIREGHLESYHQCSSGECLDFHSDSSDKTTQALTERTNVASQSTIYPRHKASQIQFSFSDRARVLIYILKKVCKQLVFLKYKSKIQNNVKCESEQSKSTKHTSDIKPMQRGYNKQQPTAACNNNRNVCRKTQRDKGYTVSTRERKVAQE